MRKGMLDSDSASGFARSQSALDKGMREQNSFEGLKLRLGTFAALVRLGTCLTSARLEYLILDSWCLLECGPTPKSLVRGARIEGD